eukprot:11623614-Alexandrium_andersonii.AAC.1
MHDCKSNETGPWQEPSCGHLVATASSHSSGKERPKVALVVPGWPAASTAFLASSRCGRTSGVAYQALLQAKMRCTKLWTPGSISLSNKARNTSASLQLAMRPSSAAMMRALRALSGPPATGVMGQP